MEGIDYPVKVFVYGTLKQGGANHDIMVRALTLERAVDEYFYRIINSLHRLVPLGRRSALALLALDKGDLEKVHPQRNFLARLGQGFGDNRMVSPRALLLDFHLDGIPVGEVAVDSDYADVLGAYAPAGHPPSCSLRLRVICVFEVALRFSVYLPHDVVDPSGVLLMRVALSEIV